MRHAREKCSKDDTACFSCSDLYSDSIEKVYRMLDQIFVMMHEISVVVAVSRTVISSVNYSACRKVDPL